MWRPGPAARFCTKPRTKQPRCESSLSLERQRIAAAATLSTRGDAIPSQLLTKIDRIISLAQRHNLTTVSCTEVLFNLLQLPFQYGRLVSTDHQILGKENMTAFMSYLRTLVDREDEYVKEQLKKCEQLSEKAVEEAKRNCDQLMRREKEDDRVTVEQLEQKRAEALAVVEKERVKVEKERTKYRSIAGKFEQLKRGLFDAMYKFDVKYSKLMAELKTEAFNNLFTQEQLSERIWWLERSAAKMEEQTDRVVAEKLVKTRSKVRGLEKRRKVLSSLVTEEKRWMKAMGKEYYHVYSHLKTDEHSAYYKQLETATSILDTMEECIQLVTEDAINRKRHCHQEQLLDELSVVSDQIHSLKPDLELETVDEAYIDLQRSIKAFLTSSEFIQSSPLLQNGTTQEEKDNSTVREEDAEREQTELEEENEESEIDQDESVEERGELEEEKDEEKDESKKESDKSVKGKEALVEAKEDSDTKKKSGPEDSESEISSCEGSSGLEHGGAISDHKHQSVKRSSPEDGSSQPCLKKSKTVHQCQHCEYVANCASQLSRHIRKHTGEKPFSCKKCNRRFARVDHLKAHMQTHKKRFKCDTCSEVFSSQNGLGNHVFEKHRQPGADCSKNLNKCGRCQNVYKTAKSLRQHILAKHCCYKCCYCSHVYVIKDELFAHSITQHDCEQQTFECGICNKKFASFELLEVHVCNNVYSCAQCGEYSPKYADEDSLKKHIKKFHP